MRLDDLPKPPPPDDELSMRVNPDPGRYCGGQSTQVCLARLSGFGNPSMAQRVGTELDLRLDLVGWDARRELRDSVEDHGTGTRWASSASQFWRTMILVGAVVSSDPLPFLIMRNRCPSGLTTASRVLCSVQIENRLIRRDTRPDRIETRRCTRADRDPCGGSKEQWGRSFIRISAGRRSLSGRPPGLPDWPFCQRP